MRPEIKVLRPDPAYGVAGLNQILQNHAEILEQIVPIMGPGIIIQITPQGAMYSTTAALTGGGVAGSGGIPSPDYVATLEEPPEGGTYSHRLMKICTAANTTAWVYGLFSSDIPLEPEAGDQPYGFRNQPEIVEGE